MTPRTHVHIAFYYKIILLRRSTINIVTGFFLFNYVDYKYRFR